MSVTPIVDNTSVYNELQFGIRRNPTVIAPSRRGFESVSRIRPAVLGATATTMTSVQAMNPMIQVSPASSVTYTLPTANSLLSEFGRNLDTGISNVKENDTLVYRILNTGTGAATLTAGAGGTGSVICPAGRTIVMLLQFGAVTSSLSGTTGTYTLYTEPPASS
jgi:hypothetical protein